MTTQQVRVGVEGKAFDNYALDCFRSCPTYYMWRIEEQISKPGAKKTAADFGSAIHLALEHWYVNGMTDKAASEAFIIFTNSFAPKQDIADDKRTLGKGLDLLSKYFQKYKHEAFNVIATEVGGTFELGEYLYIFRIDLTVEWQSPQGVYGFDHKTSSSLGRMVVKPNNQITGYVRGLSEYYSNLIGYQLNVIGVYKTEKQKDKATGKMVEREVFQRMPTSRTVRELKTWEEETLQLIKLIESCKMSGVWPKNAPSYCTAYHSKCQYLDLCTSQSKDIITPLLESSIYVKDEWKPYTTPEEGGEEE